MMSKFIYINSSSSNADSSISFPAEKLYALEQTASNVVNVFWQDSKRTGLNKCILAITPGKGYEVIDSIVSAINFGKNNLITLVDDETGVKISEYISSAASFSTSDDFVLTGDVTGDVTGDLTGDVTGDVTGDLIGSVIHTTSVTIYSSNADAINPTNLLPDSIHVHTNTATATFTFPAGGALGNAINLAAWPIGSYREIIYSNTGTASSTITGATGVTVIGTAAVAAGAGVKIVVHKTGASSYFAYVL